MIPVIWLNLHPQDCHPKQHWDTAIFQELILKGYEDWNGKPEDWPKRAVVMIAGRFHTEDVEAINRTIGYLDGCVVVIHSDEESLFPWQELEHPNMRRWVMTPSPDTKPTEGVRFIGEGWSPGIGGHISIWPELERRDWTFLGQVTHERRRHCAGVLSEMGGGLLHCTASFGAGVSKSEYIRQMVQTKFAPCPSGPVTADSFRVYEALEAGCVPLLDGIDGLGRDAVGFWELLLGPDHPLPVVWDWADLPVLLPRLLEDWEQKAKVVRHWWAEYKDRLVWSMIRDTRAVS